MQQRVRASARTVSCQTAGLVLLLLLLLLLPLLPA
jgi:hypothetical protein